MGANLFGESAEQARGLEAISAAPLVVQRASHLPSPFDQRDAHGTTGPESGLVGGRCPLRCASLLSKRSSPHEQGRFSE